MIKNKTNQKLVGEAIFFLVSGLIAVALCKLRYEIIIYSSTVHRLFSLAIGILSFIMVLGILCFAVDLVRAIKKKNHIVLPIALVLISLFLFLSVYYEDNNRAATTLGSPVVISKDVQNNTITVLPHNSIEEIILTCTSAEIVLIEVGKEYRSITYRYKMPDYTNGYLQQISVYQ